VELIVEAEQKGIVFFLEEDKLRMAVDEDVAIEDHYVNHLKSHKEAIIQVLRRTEQAQREESLTEQFQLRERPQRLPLSSAQRRLWFIDKLQGSVNYHLPTIWRLHGRLNVALLEHSLHAIVNRHEVLRTVYREEAGEVYQQILPTDSLTVSVVQKSQAALAQYIQAEVQRPFDLSTDHPLRVSIIGVSSHEHVLLLVFHHIATDGLSTLIFGHELVECYKAGLANRQPTLPVLRAQYADYALWHRNYLIGEKLDAHVRYWEDKLGGVAPLDIPTDFRRPAIHRRPSLRFCLPPGRYCCIVTRVRKIFASAAQWPAAPVRSWNR
jgi:hypothetical protein